MAPEARRRPVGDWTRFGVFWKDGNEPQNTRNTRKTKKESEVQQRGLSFSFFRGFRVFRG
jgi:hypothetical protein